MPRHTRPVRLWTRVGPRRSAGFADGRYCDLPAGALHCGGDLTSSPDLVASSAALEVNARLARLIHKRRGRFAGLPLSSLEVLRGCQAAIGIAVHLRAVDTASWGKTHRGANPPRDPGVVDELERVVAPVLETENPKAAAAVLRAWCR